MIRICLCLLPMLSALAGCSTPATHPSLRAAALPRLLPASGFAAAEPVPPGLSPDGRRVFRVTRGRLQVGGIGEIGGGPAADLEARPGAIAWAGDSRHLAWEQDDGGESRVMLFDAEAPHAAPVALTPSAGTRVRLLHAGTRRLLLLGRRDGQAAPDVWSYDYAARRLERLLQSPDDVVDYVMDVDERIGARIRRQDDGRILQLADERGRWKSVHAWSVFDDVRVLRTDRAGQRVLLLSNVGRDKTALAELSLRDGSEKLLFLHPQVDAHKVVLDPGGQPVAVWYDPDLPRTLLLDEGFHAALTQALPDGVKAWRVHGTDRGAGQAVVRAWTAGGGFDAVFERASGRLTMLDERSDDPALDTLVATRPVRFAGSDGLVIPAYLTLPRAAQRPLPLLVWLHDGPWERAWWSPTAMHAPPQFHANRGYAVLEVNYRGSAGYGRAHMEAARGEIGGRLLQDIADGVDWAVAHGIADARHVAVGGSGFGGFAAMQAASREPGRYACIIADAAIADLAGAIANPPPAWRDSLHLWRRYAGDPGAAEERARLDEISPLYGAARLRAPLLLVQGERDVLTAQEHAQRMLRALRSQDKPVRYLSFAGEGWPLRQPENRVARHRATEDFLAPCLGGRSEGVVPF
ncbi:alpha/beta hydrolase family protein [Noviherbaspirillum aridicola]|uniref:Peptidase n=1 Tax=Noviherbaspirillum aridicola TaxID=2849687 RepID=A0ABQ4Q5F7_9BURK|nr:prolyl oligopeptidase family serine peptidase [Noviherbaspirillum aridicola]GIZ52236.1 peptidase [Noviherbaspirillum aridicola]